jgi:O-methyltransferase
MRSTVKSTVRSAVRLLGYELIPTVTKTSISSISVDGHSADTFADQYRACHAELSLCKIMREIHRQDAVEIEALYRHFVFPNLPRRKGREVLLNDLIGTTVSEAIYIISALHESLQNPGDICEFGVAQGATSRLLAAEIQSLPERNLWLFDSFEGLPAPTREDKLIDDIFKLGSMDRYQGTMASPESEVLGKLDGIGFPRDRTKVKKGWVKDSIASGELPEQIAFAYVDFDFYEPIKDALEFLDKRMRPGSRIVVDDYGFFSEGAQLAVDQFVARSAPRYEFELPLPLAGHFCLLRKVA